MISVYYFLMLPVMLAFMLAKLFQVENLSDWSAYRSRPVSVGQGCIFDSMSQCWPSTISLGVDKSWCHGGVLEP